MTTHVIKELLFDLIVALWIINGDTRVMNCALDRPRDDLTPRVSRTSSPAPIYDAEQISSELASIEGVTIQHLAADFYFCTVPCGAEVLEVILREAANAAGATALTYSHHKFEPDGVSAVLILGESHLSVHYWYEKHYALVDVVTCGSCNPYAAIDVLKLKFGASSVTIRDLIRPFK